MTEFYIEKKHPDYIDVVKHYENSELLLGGTIKMREEARTTIPQNQYESAENYNRRVNASVLLNVYKETIDDLSKKPFQEQVTWDGDLPEYLKFVVDNIDGSGTSQEAFFCQNVYDSLQYGKHMYFVNMPSLVDSAGNKLSEVERVGRKLNPYVSKLNPKSLINWFYGDDNELSIVAVSYESEVLEENEVKKVNKIDYWTREAKETWVQESAADSQSNGWVSESTQPNSLGKIALIIGDNIYGLSKLENLAELNMQHFQKSSDKDNNIHTAMTPFLHFRGFETPQADVTVAVHQAYFSSDNKNMIEWVEADGEGVQIAIDDLINLERKMKVKTQDAVTSKNTSKTATEKKIDNSNEMSDLQAVVVSVQESGSKMLSLMAEWLGKPDPELSPVIYKDFNVADQAIEEIKVLQSARTNEDITQETLLKELHARKLIKNKDFDIGKEIAGTSLIIDFPDS